MELEPPVPLEDLPGGSAAFTAARSAALVAATIGQRRLADVLDQVGPPGRWAADPQAGTLELRGRVFAAESIGSFDGTSWLWAWANPLAPLPPDRTTLSRAARDAAPSPAVIMPFVDLESVAGPHDVATLLTGNGFGEAYYACDFPNAIVVYALLPGQLAPAWPRLYELQRAVTDALMHGLPDGAASLARGAGWLGLEVERTPERMIVRDEDETLVAELDGSHLVTITSTVTL